MEYVGKIKKYLSNTKWYHATTLSNWQSIHKLGVRADYNKETSGELDFGFGFYLSNKPSSAENYIIGLKRAGVLSNNDVLTIIEFSFSPLKWFEEDIYNTYVINNHNDEFALFVYENRMYNIGGQRQHKYDAIFGVMTDSSPVDTISRHRMGELSKEQVIEAFKKTMSMKQLSLHNQDLCDIISPVRVYTIYEDDNCEIIRKELNLDADNG
ncbi:MAG: DUF3990 domain-containing protein [Clostridiales bacterium]|jgi:hypothetical protein|nr:DUF3990 domain-containing protein [Clostridiales bacterium]